MRPSLRRHIFRAPSLAVVTSRTQSKPFARVVAMRAPRAWPLRCVALLCLGTGAVLAAKGAPAGATLLAASATPSSSDVPPPSFCHGLQCPEYSVLATTKAYELRRYAPSLWVSTVVTGASYDAAVNQVSCRARPRRAAAARCLVCTSKARNAPDPATRFVAPRGSTGCSPTSAASTRPAQRSP